MDLSEDFLRSIMMPLVWYATVTHYLEQCAWLFCGISEIQYQAFGLELPIHSQPASH
jgi:hypothetical protein